ncbi:MAG: hypothetical protein ACOC1X_04905 [Promethearchaeota archaeon]
MSVDNMVLKIFQREVERQCKFALLALNQINEGLSKNDSEYIFYSLQSFLIATANISKILWPNKEKYQNRGKQLRVSLDVEENSPLLSRKFRNHFEHFDERIQEWEKSSKNKIFADSIIGPPSTVGVKDENDVFRMFNPKNWEVIFRGEKYKLSPTISAIEELYKNASREANKPWWE